MSPTPQRLQTLVGITLALAMSVAGCSHTLRVGRHRTLRIALTDYRIDPQSVHASPGPLTIVVRNYGHRTHNLVLSLGSQPIGSTKPLWPGMSSDLTVSLPAGKYLFASTILNDQALGQYGTLVVK